MTIKTLLITSVDTDKPLDSIYHNFMPAVLNKNSVLVSPAFNGLKLFKQYKGIKGLMT